MWCLILCRAISDSAISLNIARMENQAQRMSESLPIHRSITWITLSPSIIAICTNFCRFPKKATENGLTAQDRQEMLKKSREPQADIDLQFSAQMNEQSNRKSHREWCRWFLNARNQFHKHSKGLKPILENCALRTTSRAPQGTNHLLQTNDVIDSKPIKPPIPSQRWEMSAEKPKSERVRDGGFLQKSPNL